MKRPILEVCCGSIESALAAQAGGADRIELCDNLVQGGTTPSFGTIELTRELLNIPIHVLIRPREGDFHYSLNELEVMKRDILTCREMGIDGVVFGFLSKDGRINEELLVSFLEMARPLSVTFHRAFDVCRDPREGLEVLMNHGVDRLLTSGQKDSVCDAAPLIRELINQAAGQMVIMPGAGLTELNIRAFSGEVGASEYHGSFRSNMGSVMQTDQEKVRKVVEALTSVTYN